MAVGYCKHSQVVTLIVSVFPDLLFSPGENQHGLWQLEFND